MSTQETPKIITVAGLTARPWIAFTYHPTGTFDAKGNGLTETEAIANLLDKVSGPDPEPFVWKGGRG